MFEMGKIWVKITYSKQIQGSEFDVIFLISVHFEGSKCLCYMAFRGVNFSVFVENGNKGDVPLFPRL